MILRRSIFIVVLTLVLALSLALNVYLWMAQQHTVVTNSNEQQNRLSANTAGAETGAETNRLS